MNEERSEFSRPFHIIVDLVRIMDTDDKFVYRPVVTYMMDAYGEKTSHMITRIREKTAKEAVAKCIQGVLILHESLYSVVTLYDGHYGEVLGKYDINKMFSEEFKSPTPRGLISSTFH